jgi:hypothetical protein
MAGPSLLKGGFMLQLKIDPKKVKSVWLFASLIICFALILSFLLIDSTPVVAAPVLTVGVHALPAFARKYGMPCSSCHDSWPRLSPFGQAFKDNGYQLMDDRDSPIYTNPGYWPVTFRITPIWHRESTNRVAVDGTGALLGTTVESKVTTHGFDWSGLDFHTAGTLAKNISFYVLPSSDATGAFHFESVWARLDNALGSSWLNIKVGKFELDNLQSEKRILTLSNIGGSYQNYHFQPLVTPGSSTNGFAAEGLYKFGLGDNQVGIEWMGHSKDDRTRISASILNSNDGNPFFSSANGSGGLITGKGYDGYFAASHAFQVGSLGLQRVGGFGYVGERPTSCQVTSGGVCLFLPGVGVNNKMFYRAGFIGMWFVKKFDVTTIYFHGHDDVNLTISAPDAAPLSGAQSPSWNGALIEPHYTVNPRLVFTGRYEAIRMSQQVLATNPSNFGNMDVGTAGLRFYPFISSRAGFAIHSEYSWLRQRGAAPVTGLDLTTGSVLLGLDFAF